MVKLRTNHVKRKLQQGEIASVVEGFHTPDILDFLGPAGFDGAWIEGEHGAIDFKDVPDMTRACDIWGMTSIVRVNNHDYGTIYRTLDQGAQGVIAPHVDTANQASAIVQAAKYAPIGNRGMYVSRQGHGVQDAEYFAKANEETLIIAMIEDIVAVHNLSQILEVDHIDVFFVAPSDLSQSMGLIGQIEHPEVQDTITKALCQIAESGRTAGAIALTPNAVQEVVDKGARLVMTSWVNWVKAGAIEFVEAVSSAKT